MIVAKTLVITTHDEVPELYTACLCWMRVQDVTDDLASHQSCCSISCCCFHDFCHSMWLSNQLSIFDRLASAVFVQMPRTSRNTQYDFVYRHESSLCNAAHICSFVQAEAAGLRADLLALRQFHLRSKALSTAGRDSSRWNSEEEEEREALTDPYKPSRQSRCVLMLAFNLIVSVNLPVEPDSPAAVTRTLHTALYATGGSQKTALT